MEKRFENGLVLGKFMPPHRGHLYLIEQAKLNCDKVYVLICSLKDEPINGTMRWVWLESIFAEDDDVEVIHCQDENPQTPEEADSIDSFYHDFWLPSVYSRIDKLDAVFTSEVYGDEFAEYLGVEHVLVDIERNTYPVSGTKVRNDAFTNWRFIPNVVKQYFTKRVAIMGPESTGKSTLTKKLAEHFDVEFLGEYGREYTENVKSGTELTKDDFYEIASCHNHDLINMSIYSTDRVIFSDTDVITTKLFGEMYLDGYKDDRLDFIVDTQQFDLYLLMDIDIPWVDDGTRDFPNPEDRKRHFNKIKAELDRLGKNYVVISGDYDERFEKSKKEVEKLGYLY